MRRIHHSLSPDMLAMQIPLCFELQLFWVKKLSPAARHGMRARAEYGPAFRVREVETNKMGNPFSSDDAFLQGDAPDGAKATAANHSKSDAKLAPNIGYNRHRPQELGSPRTYSALYTSVGLDLWGVIGSGRLSVT